MFSQVSFTMLQGIVANNPAVLRRLNVSPSDIAGKKQARIFFKKNILKQRPILWLRMMENRIK
jgi:hypothetical protein